MIHESRLLVVESKGMADAIDALKIPYLTTLSTEGYLWVPRFEAAAGRLAMVADPAKRRHRKELKERARWASQWIVATDRDASGDFIAWSIGRFLGCDRLRRCSIAIPTKHAVTEALESSWMVEVPPLRNGLEKEFGLRHLWTEVFGNRPLDAMMLASLSDIGWEDGTRSVGAGGDWSAWADESSRDIASREIASREAASREAASREASSKEASSKEASWRKIGGTVAPASTATILEEWLQMRQSSDAGSQLASLERFPEALNRLFAYRDSRIQHPLISYPRTMQRGYRPGTWERAMNQFLHSQDMEHFKPPYLREYVHEETAHESLHPLELSIQRADLLGYLDQDSLWLYESIHRHHMNAITMPRHPTTESTAGEGVTLSALAHRLSDLKVLRASGLSSAFSRWLGRRWMHLDGRRVVKGSLPEGISEKVSRWVHAWTKVALPELASGDAIHMETVRQALLEVRSS